MANMVFEITRDGFVCVVHNDAEPTNEEWGAYIAGCKENRARLRGFFVFTDGGAPNARQRGLVAEVWLGMKIPATYIFTESASIRLVLTAISWISTAAMSAHKPTEAMRVLAGCGLSEEQRQDVVHCVHIMRGKVSKTKAA